MRFYAICLRQGTDCPVGVFPSALESFAAAETRPAALVNRFIQHAYQRSPDAEPRNEPWDAKTITGELNLPHTHMTKSARWRIVRRRADAALFLSAVLHLRDKKEQYKIGGEGRSDLSGPMILAAGFGVWLTGGVSEMGFDSHGARLWAALPAVEPSSMTMLFEGHTGEYHLCHCRDQDTDLCLLGAVKWTYRERLQYVVIDGIPLHGSGSRSFHLDHPTLWWVQVLNAHGRPSGVGISVLFVMKGLGERGRAREVVDLLQGQYVPTCPRDVNKAALPCIEELLRELDIDGVAPRGWTVCVGDDG